jgi:hypothetical protein
MQRHKEVLAEPRGEMNLPHIRPRKLHVATILAVVAVLALYLSLDPERQTRSRLDAARHEFDPAKMATSEAFNRYVRRTVVGQGIEVGVITLTDGTYAKYWFESHHLGDGIGGTIVELGDNTVLFMAGFFCCEAQFPEQQFTSFDDIRNRPASVVLIQA